MLFGVYRRGVLALLLLRPEESLHLREIARLTGKAPGTLLREVNALAAAGVLLRRRVGNQVHFQANPDCPIFEDLPADYLAQVVISRVPQRLPTVRRVEIWFGALEEFFKTKPAGRLFDLYETGKIVGWEIRESR